MSREIEHRNSMLSNNRWGFYNGRGALICSKYEKKAESNAAVTSKANAGNFAPFAMKYGGNVETGMARLFLPGKELIYLSKLFQFQVVTFDLSCIKLFLLKTTESRKKKYFLYILIQTCLTNIL